MAILTLKTTIFIELKHILFDTDTFVLRKLYERSQIDPGTQNLIQPLIPLVGKYGIDNLRFVGQAKKHINPLIELLNTSITDNREDIADRLYDSVLFANYKSHEVYEDLELTDIGKSIYQILSDPNLEKIYIYCKTYSDPMLNFLAIWLDKNPRIEIVTGDKDDFLSNVSCTSYLLYDYHDINTILEYDDNESDVRKDIIVPEYKFNMTKGKLKPLCRRLTDMLDENNIYVATVPIPIV